MLFEFTEPPDPCRFDPRVSTGTGLGGPLAGLGYGEDLRASLEVASTIHLPSTEKYYVTVEQLRSNGRLLQTRPWGQPSPAVLEGFLAELDKLPNDRVRKMVRFIRDPKSRTFDLASVRKHTPVQYDVVQDEEAVLHPLELTVVNRDGSEIPYDRGEKRGRHRRAVVVVHERCGSRLRRRRVRMG